jgi:hypothetical protein
MTARLGHRVDGFGPQFIRQLAKILLRELTQVTGNGH